MKKKRKLTYKELLSTQRDVINNFLNKLNINSLQYKYAYSIRNLYLAYIELGKKFLLFELMQKIKNLILNIIKLFFKYPYISIKSKNLYYEVNNSIDSFISERINVPLFKLKWKYSFNLLFIKLVYFLFIGFVVFVKYLFTNKINKYYIFLCFPSMIDFITVYHKLKFDNCNSIITQRDRYSEEIAIILKAKNNNIKTIRLENFPSNGIYTRDTVLCDYYYSPNSINKEIFQLFEYNKDVKYIDGGFPYWDRMIDFSYQPQNNPKIISFWTQYGHDFGLFGNVGPDFYINEFIEVMPNNFILYIKIHPLDDFNKYKSYVSERVKIIKHEEIDNYKLMSICSFVFSIYSCSSMEAKHICNNSFYINYYPEGIDHLSYDFLKGHIDLITNRDDLVAFLTGKKQAVDYKKFINFFNPPYPKTTQHLKKFIESL